MADLPPLHGVGLLKVCMDPSGIGGGSHVEEFYVAIYGGRVSPHKFRSYAEAIAQYGVLFDAAQKKDVA